MEERRRTSRVSCRLRCQVRQGRKRIRARIVDISEGGLCIYSPVWLASKSQIEIEIQVPGFPDSVVRADVWHVRRQKVRDSSRKVWVVGVAIEESDGAFLELLAAASGKVSAADTNSVTAEMDPPGSQDSKDSDANAARLASQKTNEPRVFRVRVKSKSGPRTRLLTLTAESAAAAEAMAGRDLESAWTVVEVHPA